MIAIIGKALRNVKRLGVERALRVLDDPIDPEPGSIEVALRLGGQGDALLEQANRFVERELAAFQGGRDLFQLGQCLLDLQLAGTSSTRDRRRPEASTVSISVPGGALSA